MTLLYQPRYLQENLVEPYFQLTATKGATQAPGLTTPQKLERWDSLKLALFKQVRGLLYTTRIVNLMSTLQLSLTGQRYYNLELKK